MSWTNPDCAIKINSIKIDFSTLDLERNVAQKKIITFEKHKQTIHLTT